MHASNEKPRTEFTNQKPKTTRPKREMKQKQSEIDGDKKSIRKKEYRITKRAI